MPTHLDRSSLTALNPSSSDWSLCCPVSTIHSRHPSPTAFPEFPCPTPTRVPLPTSGQVEDRGLRPLFGFAPKQTKGYSAWRTTYIVLQIAYATLQKLSPIYGLLNIHKDGIRLRPIVSNRGSACQILSRFHVKIDTLLTSRSTSYVKNSASFEEKNLQGPYSFQPYDESRSSKPAH